MTNSDESQRRQIELLEALLRGVAELSSSLKAQGRVSEQIVRAVTNLATGLKEHADEHYRWMRLQEQRHDQIMSGLVETIATPRGSIPVGANGTVHIAATNGERKDVSATIAIGDSRFDISTEHLKIAKATALKWVLALLGMAASAGAAWLAGHVK